MTPERRFSQLEEVMSEMLAKQDEHSAQIRQVARSLGQVLGVALDAKDIATEARDVATEARDVAIEARDVAIEARDVAIEARDIALRAEKKVDMVANAVATLTVDMQKGFARVDEQFGQVNEQFGGVNEQLGGVNRRFDDLMDFLREKLK